MSSKGITKLCTHFHPPPPCSVQPRPSSLQHPQQYLNQNIAHNWAISPNLGRKTKCCPFWLKVSTRYSEGADSESRIRFLKFQPQHPFLGKFGPQNLKLFVLFQNWCTYLKDGDSKSRLSFWNFNPKIQFQANLGPSIQSCLFCLKIGTHGISRMLILIATLVFWISNPNFLFRQICMPTVSQH